MEGTIGEIRMFAGNFAPRAWAFCQGQLLAINSNQALFSILGTTYGGDGRTTFGLPDFRGRVPVGTGTGPGLSQVRLGQRAGQESATLDVNQLPNHTHAAAIEARDAAADGRTPEAGAFLGTPSAPIYTKGGAATPLSAVTVEATGGNQAFDLRQPWLGMNFIICLQGVFPSRN
jgi:microcystin-dependent protein